MTGVLLHVGYYSVAAKTTAWHPGGFHARSLYLKQIPHGAGESFFLEREYKCSLLGVGSEPLLTLTAHPPERLGLSGPQGAGKLNNVIHHLILILSIAMMTPILTSK